MAPVSTASKSTLPLDALRAALGARLQTDVALARWTAARVGGTADAFVETGSAAVLEDVMRLLWSLGCPYLIMGGGSNVLVSDEGVRQLVVLNRASAGSGYRFDTGYEPRSVWAELGVNLGMLARQAARLGLAGLEWAAGIPGTLGGAIMGNAGAHGSDMAGNLLVAEILHPKGKEQWNAERLGFQYRSSVLKRKPGKAVILSAQLRLERSTPEAVQGRIDELVAYRRRTQPPGASMGSMFKNPPGEFAGRLIEAAGLKGAMVGEAQISPLHANFFINHGQAWAQDIYELICLARDSVAEKFGVELELEVELVGEWSGGDKLKVGVIFGGRSGEHDVSLMSARSVIGALDPEKYTLLPIGIDRQGAWWVGEGVMDALLAGDSLALGSGRPPA